MAICIKPEVVFERIEEIINEYLTEVVIPPEFKVEFTVMPRTLEFNMLEDDQVKLIIAAVTTMIKRIQGVIVANKKTESNYALAYPFETCTEEETAMVVVNILYRKSATFGGRRILVIKG